jgi:hypothetical protein
VSGSAVAVGAVVASAEAAAAEGCTALEAPPLLDVDDGESLSLLHAIANATMAGRRRRERIFIRLL